MKKIFYFIPLFLLFIIPKVYALDCDLISSATLKDVYSSSSTSSISTSTLDTTSDNLLTCNPLFYANASSDSSQGLGWNINLTSLNSSNSYYQLNVYIRVEGNTSIIQSPFRSNSIAVGTSDASNLWVNGNTNISDFNYTINTIRNLEGKYNWTWYSLSYIFKSNTNFNKIFVPFATSSTFTGNFYLGGISLNNTGSASLTENEINNLLSNQSNQILNDLLNVENNINDTINDNFNTCKDSYNLVNFNNISTYTTNGISFIPRITNGYLDSITVRGTATATAFYPVLSNLNLISGEWQVSGSRDSVEFYAEDIDDVRYKGYIPSGKNITSFWIRVASGQTVNLSVYPMVRLTSSPSAYIPYGKQICQNKIDETNEQLGDINISIQDTNNKLDDLNSSINDSNSSGATDSAGGFFNNFEDNDFGLSGIITAPLNTIKTITNNSCTPLNLTIPFVNKDMTLPCMTDIYEEHFGSFLDIYQIITFGIISYWVCVQIYAMVKGFKNPDKDEIEVMDL